MFGKHADFVCKPDLDSVKRVANILDHFGGGHGCFEGFAICPRVQLAQWLELSGVLRPENGEWGLEKILDGCSFPQKLWIVADGEISTALFSAGALEHRRHYPVSRSRQYSAAQHHPVKRLLRSQSLANVLADSFDALKIQLTIALAWCA